VSDEQITPDESSAGANGPSRRGLLKAGLVAGAVAGAGGWRSAPGNRGRHHHLRKPNSRPYPHLPAGTDTIPQIEHIVVLMMENHSYDNRLGMLNRHGADGFRLHHGLPTATNPYANGDLQHAFRMPTTCQLDGKPAQDWLNSHIQFNHGRNDGFVESGSGPVSMGYWQQADQPFYYSLAQAFPIADRYFCSVLGQTYPNRRYLMAATSIGQVDDTLPKESDYPANGTIFDKLDAQGITWRDYYTTLPTTLLYPQLYLKNHGTKVIPIAQFFTDAAAGKLPGFCLVEPDYGNQSEENPQNIAAGEQFAAQVINAVVSGPRLAEDAADLELRRARRLLRPRAAAARDRARQHPARRAGRPVHLQRLPPVRFSGSLRVRLAVGPAAPRVSPAVRPHQRPGAGGGQVEPPGPDLPGRQRQQHAGHAGPAAPGVPYPAVAGPAAAGHRPGRACLQHVRARHHPAAGLGDPATPPPHGARPLALPE